MTDDLTIGGVLTTIIILGACIWGVSSCVKNMNTPEYKAAEQARYNECETPKKVSEVNGLELWVVKPSCRDSVYFSKSGTSREWSERHGKTTTHKRMDVPNELPQ